MKIGYSIVFLIAIFLFSCKIEKGEYVCTPCDLPCDDLTFAKPGTCPNCQMDLIKSSDSIPLKESAINEIDIQTGSGSFRIEGGDGKQDKTIQVFYHRPESFRPDSKILLVIPGAGRNGDSYRDAWIEESEKYSLLILSPMYPEDEYGFDDYHLCGLISGSNLKNSVTYVENSNIAKLDEAKFDFKHNTNPDQWIFDDFDRIFDLTTKALQSTRKTYDIFGHSAGGHILHRLALFHENSKAELILASNPSFYTLPSFELGFPFGLKNTPIGQESLKSAFKKKLVVFLGELDNENETGGTFLRSTSVDKQGLHRLERGKFFFKLARQTAEALDVEFNWQMVIVPDVGHDHRLMGDAAGTYLYGKDR